VKRYFEDTGYAIEMTVINHAVIEFDVGEEYSGAPDSMMRGFLKWDGCINIEFYNYVHFCGKEEAMNLGVLLGYIYDMAAEMMPENAAYFK